MANTLNKKQHRVFLQLDTISFVGMESAGLRGFYLKIANTFNQKQHRVFLQLDTIPFVRMESPELRVIP